MQSAATTTSSSIGRSTFERQREPGADQGQFQLEAMASLTQPSLDHLRHPLTGDMSRCLPPDRDKHRRQAQILTVKVAGGRACCGSSTSSAAAATAVGSDQREGWAGGQAFADGGQSAAGVGLAVTSSSVESGH